MLPCKVGQRPRLEGPRWSRHTHTPHPCRQGPEPRGQGPSTPHRWQGQQEERRTQLEAPAPSAWLAALDSELESRQRHSLPALGRAVGLWATRGQGPQPGLGDHGEGGFGTGSAKVTHAHQAHTTHTRTHTRHTHGEGAPGLGCNNGPQQQGRSSRLRGWFPRR